jgi:NAD(P)-dependent dehydrogenase (short-subunit alcohol dehydrogenase family)
VGSAILIGAGPKVGLPVARRFAREGFDIGLVARSAATLDAAEADLRRAGAITCGVIADVTDEPGLQAGLGKLTELLGGVPDVVIYNVAGVRRDVVGELTAQQQLENFHLNVIGALTAAAHLAPRMSERRSGTILITGGGPRPERMVSLTHGKDGVRSLVRILDATYGQAGVHVASVRICKTVAAGTDCDPVELADLYWRLHSQPRGSWESEIIYPV